MRRSDRTGGGKRGAERGDSSSRSGSKASPPKPWSRAEFYAAGKALRIVGQTTRRLKS
jgi:hypothetical protein